MAEPKARAHRLGWKGELAAMVLLLLKGYRHRHRNWSGGGGELDLVMSRGDLVVFVEVKLRSSDEFGGALAAVGTVKRQRLVRAAAAYLTRYSLWDRPCRFDVIGLERAGAFPWWRLRHVHDAFRPDLGRMM